MLDHVAVQVRDVTAAVTFYCDIFAPLGIHELMRYERADGVPVLLLSQEADSVTDRQQVLYDHVAHDYDSVFKPHVSEHYPLARAAEAITRLANRQALGKVVVTVG